eukprot:8872325-Alexandrium_andersonii.AAC.1
MTNLAARAPPRARRATVRGWSQGPCGPAGDVGEGVVQGIHDRGPILGLAALAALPVLARRMR